MAALQHRISELKQQGIQYRQLIDERYTATVLLEISQTATNGDSQAESKTASVKSSSMLYGNAEGDNKQDDNNIAPISSKRVRRRGKYSLQERESVRRERNRMHAKKNRDRKKAFFELSEKTILDLELESKMLRNYLVGIQALSQEDASASEQHDEKCRQNLLILKQNFDCNASDDGSDEAPFDEDNTLDNTHEIESCSDDDTKSYEEERDNGSDNDQTNNHSEIPTMCCNTSTTSHIISERDSDSRDINLIYKESL